MKRAIITGITGQDGSYLAEALLADGYGVRGLSRRSPQYPIGWAEPLRDRIEIATGDLSDGNWVESQVAEFQPAEIYHLAFPRRAPAKLNGYQEIEKFASQAVVNLLTTCERYSPATRVLNVVGHDSLVENPTFEANHWRFQPHSAAAALRLQTVSAVDYFRTRRNLFAATAFVFPHFSLRADPSSTPRRIARMAAKAGLSIPLTNHRDMNDGWTEFGYAPDYVDAFRSLINQKTPADAILRTGSMHRVRDFADACFSYVGLNHESRLHWLPNLYASNERSFANQPSSPGNSRLVQSADIHQIARTMVESEIAKLRRDLRRGWHRKLRAA